VIDDVVTTGSTLRSAAAALRSAGARSVQRAAVATTPAMRHDRPTTRSRSVPSAVEPPTALAAA
jgi:orotate phosphoribosyltransferase